MKKKNIGISILWTTIKTVFFVFFVCFIAMVMVQKFSNNNLSIAGVRLFTVVSESMVPRYEVGDVLLINQVNYDQIKLGDNLCYQGIEGEYAGKVITHEVRDIKNDEHGYTFLTQGIANANTDPIVKESQVYGIVAHKTFLLSFVSKLAYNKNTFYICVFVPVLALIIYYFYALFSSVSKRLDEKVDEVLSEEDENYIVAKNLDKLKSDLEEKKKNKTKKR